VRLVLVSMRPLPFESRWRVVRATVAVALFVALSVPARAEPADGPAGGPARELWLQGNQYWEAGDYARAADRFDRAYEIEHTPVLGLWVARSLARAGRLLAAAARYDELSKQNLPSDAGAKDWGAKRDAQAERQRLLLRVPSVVVTIDGAPKEQVSVTVNDQPLPPSSIGLPRLVDPGSVRVRGTRGESAVEATVELDEGEVKTARLAFGAPRPVPPSATQARASQAGHGGVKSRSSARAHGAARAERTGDGRRVVGYVAMGVGGAALLTGSVFGLLSLDDQSRLDGRCPDSLCPPNLSSDLDAYESRKTIATVGLLSGAALTAAGFVLYVTAPRSEHAARVGLFWHGQTAGFQGAF
jgi:hypothetical protein